MDEQQKIYEVSEVNGLIKELMDGTAPLQHIMIRGELSNYKIYPSGHHYFTLKDGEGSLRCVMFRSSAAHLKFRPESGMKVVATGRITVFPRDGAYQLYCTQLSADGIGDLYVAFEQLKEQLQREGLFDPAHKKLLPPYPQRIAIITSSAGAAVHDMTGLRDKIRSLRMDEAEKARKVDTLRFQIEELERAAIKVGEETELTARRELLRNSEKFISAVGGADYYLNGDENHDGALSQLREAQSSISGAKNLGDSFLDLFNRLESLYSEVYDLADTVRDMKDGFDFSPTELDRIEGRLDQLYRLKKKYGASEEDMLDYLERCRKELDAIEYADDTLARLTKELSGAEKEAKKRAKALSEARKAAALELEKRILSELKQLDMGRIQFSISITEKELDASGMDQVRFLMSANMWWKNSSRMYIRRHIPGHRQRFRKCRSKYRAAFCIAI